MSTDILAAFGLESFNMEYMKFCSVWKVWTNFIGKFPQWQKSAPRAYRIQFHVFLFGIHVFNVGDNVIFQERSQWFVGTSEQLEEQLQQIKGRNEIFIPQQD